MGLSAECQQKQYDGQKYKYEGQRTEYHSMRGFGLSSFVHFFVVVNIGS